MINRRAASVSLAFAACALSIGARTHAGEVPIGGFVPFVGMAETREAKNSNSDTFFLADVSDAPTGPFLGDGSSTYYDVAVLDTGAAAHVLAPDAVVGFDIADEGFEGTNTQPIGTASGIIDLGINQPHGVYVAGLKDRVSAGNSLVMNNAALKGQTTYADLSAPDEWKFTSVIGLPMAAQHAIAILNSDPQIFEYKTRTLRTPQIELRDIGSGGGNILRRAPLLLRPGDGFITGPLFTFTLDPFSLELVATSPTVVPNAGLFLEVDMAKGSKSFQDKEFLLDTGADLTFLSQITAKRLGFDVLTDTPDFVIDVEDPSGVSSGVPGVFIDELNIDTVGGNFTLHNVPVGVLDLPDPTQPGNVLAGVIGTHLFTGRDLVIDAEPAQGQGGVGPSFYISDPVTQTHTWSTNATSGNWATTGNWNAAGTPDKLWVANAVNASGNNQSAIVSANSTVFELHVSGTPSASMTVQVDSGATLTTFGEALISQGGAVLLNGGKLDTLFVNIEGGTLSGSGTVFAGSGPIRTPVRNLSGRVAPGNSIGELVIDGDFSNLADATLAIQLGGTTAVSQYDRLSVGRFASLDGTLEVSLANAFTPSVGDMFMFLTAGSSVSGTFESLVLPAGFSWNVAYGLKNVVLTVTGLGVAGDYNANGVVDAADYGVWRKNRGIASGASPSQGDGDGDGDVDNADYGIWRAHFGKTNSGPGSGSSPAVPEPSTFTLLSVACVLALVATLRPARCGASSCCGAFFRV